MTPFGRRNGKKGPKRTKTVGGCVTEKEYDESLDSFEDSGFANQSVGVRAIVLSFARDVTVRHAVAEAIRKHKLLPGV